MLVKTGPDRWWSRANCIAGSEKNSGGINAGRPVPTSPTIAVIGTRARKMVAAAAVVATARRSMPNRWRSSIPRATDGADTRKNSGVIRKWLKARYANGARIRRSATETRRHCSTRASARPIDHTKNAR